MWKKEEVSNSWFAHDIEHCKTPGLGATAILIHGLRMLDWLFPALLGNIHVLGDYYPTRYNGLHVNTSLPMDCSGKGKSYRLLRIYLVQTPWIIALLVPGTRL